MIASLDDAWNWYESARRLARAMGRLGEKHWNNLPWDGDLGRDNHLNNLASAEILNDSESVLGDLDDLCVLLLFSVLEAAIRERVLAEVEAELPPLRHVTIKRAFEEMKEGIEHGSFFKVLEPYKDLDANLIEQVNQVRRYRNWVAHGRRTQHLPLSILRRLTTVSNIFLTISVHKPAWRRDSEGGVPIYRALGQGVSDVQKRPCCRGLLRLGNAEDAARLLVTFLQVQRHGEILRQPQRQRRQRLPKGERRGPTFQQPHLIRSFQTTGHGVKVRRFGPQRWIHLPDRLQ